MTRSAYWLGGEVEELVRLDNVNDLDPELLLDGTMVLNVVSENHSKILNRLVLDRHAVVLPVLQLLIHDLRV